MNRKPTYEELLKRINKLEQEISECQFIKEELKKSKGMLKTVLDSLPFDVFALDLNNRYILQNSTCRKNWGNLIGKSPKDVPVEKNTQDLWMNNNNRALSGETIIGEVEYQSLEGKKFYYHNILAPIRDEEKIYGILGVLVDISDRKQIEECLETSLKVKEMLMDEIHHRVKNNLETISSLLELSSVDKGGQENRNLLSDLRSRINSMALIHTQLYENNRFDQIDMGKQIQKMLDFISGIYGSIKKPVDVVVEASQIYLSVNQAIPCSLALNEIITNSFKHAFKENKKGTINVFLNNPTESTVFISVKDDGVGIPQGIDFKSTKGVGLNLAKNLIEEQLKGEIRVNHDDGTEICIEFNKLKL